MSKYLIMTGGSRGIGKKTIAHFMENGWKAINLSRSACELPGVINLQMDLADVNSIENQKETLLASLQDASSICLIHNAAYYQMDSMAALSLAHLRLTLEVNLIAPVVLNSMLIPVMPPQSSIIYLGSTLAEKAVPGSASYIVSKHALLGLMRATCQDLAPLQIRSCCVCPGLVDTQLLKDSMDPAIVEFLLKNKIMGGRLIAPDEIAQTLYFCAISTVINGATIHANLGHFAD